MVVNSEQIRFYQKGRVETEEGPLSPSRPEGNPLDRDTIWNRTHPRVQLWTDRSGNDTTNC